MKEIALKISFLTLPCLFKNILNLKKNRTSLLFRFLEEFLYEKDYIFLVGFIKLFGLVFFLSTF